MDEQTLSLIEALAKLRTLDKDFDPDEITLAQKKVRTPEGVKKYDQPIGTIITKDMIEQAAAKAAQAASKSLHSAVGGKSSTSQSSSSSEASSTVKKATSSTDATQEKLPTVPGNQTSADIDNFFVSSYVNDPSKASVAWVQKKDGSWYQQSYENGKITQEKPLDPDQVNALVVMEQKGLIYTGHINDPEPKNEGQDLTDKIKKAFDEGKTPQDPEVKKMIGQLAALEGVGTDSAKPDSPKKDSPSAEKSTQDNTSEAKTVTINGKQVKVGRYSRPKGFAKAFLIVHEDGTVEYEDKKGARKKITHNSFKNHQDLGMTKFLTEDTGPLKKDEHFEDGKLVKDASSQPEAPAAKVEPVKTPTPEPKKEAPQAEKPVQEGPKTTAPSGKPKIKFEDLDKPKLDLPKKEGTESGTVKVGSLTVKPGRYSRPKGFAKAFLIVHPDGTVEYENKKGERKKISAKAFESHWNLGMTKFLTSDTGAIKSGNHFEDGKLVNDAGTPDVPEVKAPETSPAIAAAKEAATALKAKQDAKKEEPKTSSTKFTLIKGNKVEVPENTSVYYNSSDDPANAELKYVRYPDGSWGSVDSGGVHKFSSGGYSQKLLDGKLKDKKVFKEDGTSSKSESSDIKTQKIDLESPSGVKSTYDIPADAELYSSKANETQVKVGLLYYKDKDGTFSVVGASTGKKPLSEDLQKAVQESIDEGKIVKWTPGKKKEDTSLKTFSVTHNFDIGDTKYEFPEGTAIYVADNYKDNDSVATFTAVLPNGEMYRVGYSSGKKEVTGYSKEVRLKQIASGALVKWSKYHSAKTPDKSSSNVDYVSIKGKPVTPLAEGSKVYFLKDLQGDKASIKYVKDTDGNWSIVAQSGTSSANKTLSTNLDTYLGQGELTEDTAGKVSVPVASTASDIKTEAEKVVDSNKDLAPAASPTEVKSVKISGMDIKPGKYSIGKSFAKAFLLVHPDGTTEYVNKEGKAKKLTPAAFKKNWDAGMNKYAGPLDAAKGPSQVTAPPATLNGPKVGTYYTKQFDTAFNFDTISKLEIKEDGSAVAEVAGNKVALTPEVALDSFKYGTVMDEFGNSSLIPGFSKPEQVHIFGSTKGISLDKLDSFREDVVTGKSGILTTLKNYAGSVNLNLMLAYKDKHFPGDVAANKKAVVKAIDDIQAALGNKQADKPNVANVPDPVKSIFKQDEHGYFIKPDVITDTEENEFNYYGLAAMNEALKKISLAFDGKILSSPPKLSKYAKQDWYSFYQQGNFKGMYQLEKSSGMEVSPLHPGAPDNKDTHQVKWAPAIPGELPAGKIPEGEWTWNAGYMSDEEVNNYLIAANMAYPTHLATNQKKYWVSYHMSGDSYNTDLLSLKAKQHATNYPNQPYSEPPVWNDKVTPKKAYTDSVESSEPADYWSSAALKAYVEDYPELVPEGKSATDYYGLIKYIQNHMDTAKAEREAKKAAELAEAMKPKFQKVPGQGVSGGHHEAMVLQDQFGKKWVYKPRDKNDEFLADVEQAAHELSWAWGYKTAKSFITDFDDRRGHVQQMFDAEKDLSNVDMGDLTSAQITDVAKEHLLDWALDNDDTWGANALVISNGSIVGIDKGRSFVGMGHWNGLTADSSAHVHMPLIYTSLYQAIANKKISQEDANAAYFAVIKQARKMEKLSDTLMTAILEEGFKNRTNWNVGGGPSNKEDAIKAAIERKNSLVKDMETLWDNVFSKAGYDKPEAPKGVIVNDVDQDVHLGVTPAALEQAKANGSYGASVFYSGPEIEDAHLLLYHTKTKGGIEQLNGEMKIREESKAYKDVETWLKNNAVKVGNAYGYTPENMKPSLPNESDYYEKILVAVKNISVHAIDGSYNESKLNGMSWVKNTLQNYVNDYDSKMSNPITQADMVKQYKDPEAYLEMAKTYLGYIAKAEDHKAQGTKSAPGEFSPYVWTPKKEEKPESEGGEGSKVKVELRQASSAKAVNDGVPKFEEDGSLQHHYGYTTDGNPGSMYLVTLPTGETIEFRGNTTGTPSASKGLTRFTMPAGGNEAASMERIRAQMAEMGLKMEDSDESQLELYYWRHLAGIMNAREDTKSGSTPAYKKFNAEKPVETANMSAEEELEAWKKAFSNLSSREQIDEFISKGGHLPKFGHYHLIDPEKYSGQPYWERFDVTDDKAYTKQLPSGAFYDDSHAQYVISTGGMLSTEARLRTLGMWKGGMSSSSDQSYGSSGFVFIRQNLEAKPGTSDYNLQHIYYSPKILKRTHTYSFSGDNYGNMEYKASQSSFDFDKLSSHAGGSNEVMIKHAVSLLDDIEIVTFTDTALRNKVIQQLKDMGITEIRGVPIEKRFVMRNKNDVLEAQKAVKEAWKSV